MSIKDFRSEIEQKERFEFGKNWLNFLSRLNAERIKQAELSLQQMFQVKSLSGKSFLDVGSGSGLFSLAARNLGASVTSFDFDELSVRCTNELKNRYHKDSASWEVKHGSALDADFLKSLGEFDIVYSWGVLHHTGDMWQALANVVFSVSNNGLLFISLYNYQQFASKYWSFVKRTYNRFPITRPLWILLHFCYPVLPSVLLRLIGSRKLPRGMTVWYDLLDWLGGYPFEVSKPEEVFDFLRDKDFALLKLKTVGGKHGCNEYVFRRAACD